MKKRAIILCNLGGPDSLEAVRPFLFNLFNDKAIISVPWPFRTFLAWLISSRREETAKHIYSHMGGKSPILEETKAQADALQKLLSEGDKVFIAMRYWHPFTVEVVKNVKAFAPDEIIFLPLYPQYSTTTTASSFALWKKECQVQGLDVPTRLVCCYPSDPQFISAHVSLIRPLYKPGMRLLFSAHGLPKKIIEKGDPYQWQVERTVAAIVKELAIAETEYQVSYQSRVGPLEWIGPATDAEILRAGGEKKSLLVVPVAFVSEHSETLVELDIEYKKLAEENGVPEYVRVPTLSVHPDYIGGLVKLCNDSESVKRLCPSQCVQCGCQLPVASNR